jgi:glucose/arabinose dehydrogenase
VVAAVVGVAVLVAAVVLFGVWRGWFADPSVSNAPQVQVPAGDVRTIANGLRAPWGLAFLPDGSAVVTERDTARIVTVTPSGTVTEVQRLAEVRPSGEGGLLGIAVSPSYASDGWVYVYYSTADDNRIARLHLGSAPEPIFTGIPRAGNHNGGRIAFGPDGMLYAGTGDAGDRSRSQNRDDLGGKILRLTPDGKPAPGNPFNTAIYSYGHRNVQGLAWDSSGTMYASEFGQNQYDELNRITAGRNYGWPVVEGPSDDSRFVAPVATWATSDASPSGIAVAGDKVYMACLRGERLYRISPDGTSAEALFTGTYGRLRNVTLAPDRSLWILTSNRDGRGQPTAADDRIVRLQL